MRFFVGKGLGRVTRFTEIGLRAEGSETTSPDHFELMPWNPATDTSESYLVLREYRSPSSERNTDVVTNRQSCESSVPHSLRRLTETMVVHIT